MLMLLTLQDSLLGDFEDRHGDEGGPSKPGGRAVEQPKTPQAWQSPLRPQTAPRDQQASCSSLQTLSMPDPAFQRHCLHVSATQQSCPSALVSTGMLLAA